MSGTTTTHRPTDVRTFIVCLPTGTDHTFAPALVQARLSTFGHTYAGTVPHFLVNTRRIGRLIDCWQGFTCGGPIGLLGLDLMRRHAAIAAQHTWHRWNYVVAGTRPAQPFGHFFDRHRTDERRYPLHRAQRDYLNQPRIIAMRAFNALPNNGGGFDGNDLEAFQAGLSTFTNLAALAVVVADGVSTAEGTFHTPVSRRLEDQLTYLHHANHHLAGLHRDTPIVAIAVNGDQQP